MTGRSQAGLTAGLTLHPNAPSGDLFGFWGNFC